MKRHLTYALIFLLGLIAGITIMGELSQHASKAHVKILKEGHIGHLQKLANDARRRDDHGDAAYYYRLLVDLTKPESGIGIPEREWNFDFPFFSFMIYEIAQEDSVVRG